MQSYFIDWNEPFIQTLVCRILDRNLLGAVDGDRHLDLSPFVFVFPSGRALRTFEAELAGSAEARIREGKLRADWTPPKVVLPIGELPEILYTPPKLFADRLAGLLAWNKALRAKESGTRLLFPKLPAPDDFAGWLAMAEPLARLHQEVASEGLDFTSPRKYVEGKKEIPNEVLRWNALCEIQDEYYKTLERCGLCDKQVERLNAVKEKRIVTEKKIVLVGTADLNRLQKLILDRVSEQTIAIVQAPETAKDLFDDYGCVVPEKWQECKIGIPHEEEWIIPASDPVEEGIYAACFTHMLGSDGNRTGFSRRRAAVSLLDPDSRPYLTEKLADLGIKAHFGEGKPFASGRTALLLRGAADYLRGLSYEDFAAWVRHPDVTEGLLKIAGAAHADDGAGQADRNGNNSDWLSELDQYQSVYIPQRISLSDEAFTSFPRSRYPRLYELIRAVKEALKPLGDPEGKTPLKEFPARINRFLSQFYFDAGPGDAPRAETGPEEDELPPEDQQINQGLAIIYKAFDAVSALPEDLISELTPGEAVGFILRAASGDIREEASGEEVDVIGWLDARFEKTPNLILVGFNEGIIPESRSLDLFLPDTVRTEVQIENNARRYARDAYYLTTVVRRQSAGEENSLRILFARKSADGSPIPPSRLLFAEEDDVIARRVSRFFGGAAAPGGSPEEGALSGYYEAAAPPEAETADAEAPGAFALPVLSLAGRDLPDTMHVTDFSSFLQCPYRYFLEKIFKLETLDDRNSEIGSATFGNVVHDVLREFGTSGKKDSTDEKEIGDFLSEILDKTVKKYQERNTAGTALLQLELIRDRLRAFASWQAKWRKTGTRILWVETPGSAKLDEGDPASVTLKGRIDRIDYNQQKRQYFVFDYKTFDKIEEKKSDEAGDLSLAWITDCEDPPKINAKTGNQADVKHRGKGNDVRHLFASSVSPGDPSWTDLQLPLYTLLVKKIIDQQGGEPLRDGEVPKTAYIVLSKDNSVGAYFGNWSQEQIAGAVQTARDVRAAIVRLWNGGTVDPDAFFDPDHEDLGRLYEPPKSKKSWDTLRDFPN